MYESNKRPEDTIDWGEDGIVPVVVQSLQGEVVTLAYMDRESLSKTLTEGYAHYYSRSKERIRMKGEVSGNTQQVKEIKVDCDSDALLFKVRQSGPACHTGRQSCFYRKLGEPKIKGGSIDYSLNVLKELETVIQDRLEKPREDSYTTSLFQNGSEQIRKKLGEEVVELILANEDSNIIHEAADLLYHLLVLLADESLELNDVMAELGGRRG